MLLDEISKDLKAGYGLDETLRKHNTNLHEVLAPFERNYPSNVKRNKLEKGMAYIIRQRNGNYRIVKEIRRRKVSFGTYSSLDDAKIVRDKLMDCDWDKSRLNDILKDCSVKRNPVGGFHKTNK